MTALINDLKRLGLIHGKGSGKDPGPRGGTGSKNSKDEILKRLIDKQPFFKKLLSAYKKKMKTKDKPMKAAKGGSVNIKSITKKQFLEMPNSEIDKLSFKQIQDLMRKFMPEVGEDSSDIKMRKQGGMMKKKGYAMGGAMKKKGYAKGGAMSMSAAPGLREEQKTRKMRKKKREEFEDDPRIRMRPGSLPKEKANIRPNQLPRNKAKRMNKRMGHSDMRKGGMFK